MLKGRGHWNVVTIVNAAGVPSGNYFVAVKIAWRGAVSHGPPMAELTDSTTTVAELKTRVLAFVRERDWEQFHSPKNLSMALAAEAGELMEHFLWATPEASKALVQDAVKRQKIADELADVVVYALEFANATGLDVAASIEAKMIANASRAAAPARYAMCPKFHAPSEIERKMPPLAIPASQSMIAFTMRARK
jgi:NTP pyrophosphatase (non-canonical NTP hydrolase)